MAIYTDEMGTSQSVATTLIAMDGSPYSPLKSGKLIGVRLAMAGDAATSLIENVTVLLTCPKFNGVNLWVSGSGGGIRTAPAVPIPVAIQACDLDVETGVPITLSVVNRTGATPVTPQYQVIGIFEG